MARQPLVPSLVVAVITGAIAGWFAGASADRGPVPMPASDRGQADNQAIVDELRRLGADLRAFAARPATGLPSSTNGERRDASPDSPVATTADERLLATLEQMLIRIEQIATRQLADNGTLQRLAAERVADPQALGELLRHIDADWNTAQRYLFLMPMTVVLQRFGPPTFVNMSGSNPTWVYEFEFGEDRRSVSITFHDGVVVQVS